jgi:hypothetical protein
VAVDDIRAALDTAIETVAGSAVVAWPNTADDEPAAATLWYRPTFMPGEPWAVELMENGRNRHVGLYQIDVFSKLGEGEGVANGYADAIVAAFKRGTVLTYGTTSVVIEKAWRETGRPDPEVPYWHIPVRVRWRADLAN